MNLISTLKMTALSTALLLAGCSSNTTTMTTSSTKSIPSVSSNAVYSKPRTLDNFNDYVQFLKGKAAAEGVSLSVLNAQNNIQYMQKAVDIAEERYWEVQAPLQQASQRYGVQQEYILALWGMESSFGYYQGSYDVLSALATLAFDGRREALFSKEFVNAMKMLERDHIQRNRMLGSWAGAMGQTQFMPSAFLNYAADGNNDGVKDIWKNQFDAFASIANYLHTVGWDNKLPWGVEVTLNQPLDLSLSGIEKNKARSLSDWQSKGVTLASFSQQEQDKLAALSQADLWLVRPDKEVGRAFLVSNNYRTILDWNKSNYFGVSIGMFADRIKMATGL